MPTARLPIARPAVFEFLEARRMLSAVVGDAAAPGLAATDVIDATAQVAEASGAWNPVWSQPADEYRHLHQKPAGDGGTLTALQWDFSNAGGPPGFVLEKRLADGTLDSSFGDGGRLLIGDDGTDFWVSDWAVDAQGRIVAVGQDYLDGRLVAERRLADGSVDATFGDAGTLRPHLDTDLHITAAIVVVGSPEVRLDDDGRLYLIGDGGTMGHWAYVARLTADGQVDATYGAAGSASFFTENNSLFDRLAVAGDGTVTVDYSWYEGDTPLSESTVVLPSGEVVFTPPAPLPPTEPVPLPDVPPMPQSGFIPPPEPIDTVDEPAAGFGTVTVGAEPVVRAAAAPPRGPWFPPAVARVSPFSTTPLTGGTVADLFDDAESEDGPAA